MDADTQTESYLTKEEAAKHLKISQAGLQKWMARRLVPYFKISRAVRFRRVDLDAALDRRFRVEAKAK